MRDKVLKNFAASGIHPFNPSAVLGAPRPPCEERMEHILVVEELADLFEKMRTATRLGLCFQPLVLRRGWVDKSKGLTLTRPDVSRKREWNGQK